ncbi:MAG: hypothetical protein WBU20_27845 [Candidatus Acidiferrum sp.]
MKEDDFQKWIDACTRGANQGKNRCDGQAVTCIRVSNARYAKDATLEDRLSPEDRQMLSDMGISL